MYYVNFAAPTGYAVNITRLYAKQRTFQEQWFLYRYVSLLRDLSTYPIVTKKIFIFFI